VITRITVNKIREIIFKSFSIHFCRVILNSTYNLEGSVSVYNSAMGIVVGLSSTLIATAAFADKATEIPECSPIAKSCEAAGFEPGHHKKNGKGLWIDCIHAIAKGKTVAGVTGTEAEAKTCLEAAKAMKKKK
jgi:hypothetical protein